MPKPICPYGDDDFFESEAVALIPKIWQEGCDAGYEAGKQEDLEAIKEVLHRREAEIRALYSFYPGVDAAEYAKGQALLMLLRLLYSDLGVIQAADMGLDRRMKREEVSDGLVDPRASGPQMGTHSRCYSRVPDGMDIVVQEGVRL